MLEYIFNRKHIINSNLSAAALKEKLHAELKSNTLLNIKVRFKNDTDFDAALQYWPAMRWWIVPQAACKIVETPDGYSDIKLTFRNEDFILLLAIAFLPITVVLSIAIFAGITGLFFMAIIMFCILLSGIGTIDDARAELVGNIVILAL